MPMEPNRTRQVIQDLAKTFNKLASELAADLSYAAREIDSLRKEVQRLRSSPGKTSRSNGNSKNSSSRRSKSSNNPAKKSSVGRKTPSHHTDSLSDSPKPAHEASSFVFPQESLHPSPPDEPSSAGNN